MKKLLIALFVGLATLGAKNADAHYRNGCKGSGSCGRKVQYDCPPPPCCERQELVTVRKPAEMVCGWVCPDGTEEMGAELDNPCCPKVSRR